MKLCGPCTATWERCCLGLPRLVVSLADNQGPACQVLAAAGAIRYPGHHEQVTVSMLLVAIEHSNVKPAELLAWSIASTRLLGGTGVERVLRTM